MDDLLFGKRNKRGDWTPNEPLQYAPLFRIPFDPKAFLKWLPHYFFPWNVLFALSAVAYWAWVIPPVETMRTLAGELFPVWRERFALVTGRADAGGAGHGERA